MSMLGSHVPARAALVILGDAREHLAGPLAGIPTNLDLVDADDSVIDGRSTVALLRDVLLRLPGVGPVTAGKILARKRPRLVPTEGGAPAQGSGHSGPGYWRALRDLLRADDCHLHRLLTEILGEIELDGTVSAVRAFDVLARLDDDRDYLLLG